MVKRLNTPLIMLLIGASVTFVLSIVGIIYFAIFDNFLVYFDSLMLSEVTQGQTIAGFLQEMFPSIQMDSFRSMVYIYYLVSGILGALFTIPAIILAILCFKDNENSVEEFHSRHKLHVFLLISIGVCYLGTNLEMGSLVSSSFLSIASVVLLVLAFFRILGVIRTMNFAYKLQQARKDAPQFQQDNQDVYPQESFDASYTNEDNGKQISEENLDKPEIKEEEVVIDHSKLEEMYELLAKLEKSYKNGEVSEQDYLRMKQTIIETHLK